MNTDHLMPTLLTSLLLALAAPAFADDDIRIFGTPGTDGAHGQSGRQGSNGPDLVIKAGRHPQTVITRGSDGQPGGNGRNGRPAEDCYIPRRARRDIEGARGGDGGNGGRGGNGGHGGNVTILYHRLADLRSLRILSNPGRGANGGYPGYGAPGCQCPRSRWRRRVCVERHFHDPKTHPDDIYLRCRRVVFRCEDGRHGRDGLRGPHGRDGLPGKLTLIRGRNRPAEERDMLQIPVHRITQRNWRLSRNNWEQRNNAASLLAPGSIVADRYRLFTGQTVRGYAFRWRARRPLRAFSGNVTLRLVNDRVISSFPATMWTHSRIRNSAGMTTETVTHAIYKHEAMRLAFRLITLKKRPVIVISETASRPAGVTTRFRIRIEGSRFLGWKTLYHDAVPAAALRRTSRGWQIEIARLPIAKRWLDSGQTIRVRLETTRTFYRNSATLVFTKRFYFEEEDPDDDDV